MRQVIDWFRFITRYRRRRAIQRHFERFVC